MSATTINTDTVQALKELLARPRHCAIIPHFNPDGDALGSSTGLAGLLRAAGHSAQVVLPNTPPGNLHWMPGYPQVVAGDVDRAGAEAQLRTADVVFCLDFNRQDRVGPLEEALRQAQVKVMVDHHRDPDDFARVTISDTSSPATAQLVYDLAVAMGWQQHIDADIATDLLTGIITDTGSFRFRSTTAHTLRVAAELMDRGAVPDRIHAAVMDDNSPERMRLMGFTLTERMQVLPELGAVVMHLSSADLEAHGFQPGDTEGFVNLGLGIRGIKVSTLLIQRGDTVKLSMRSKGELAVNGFLSTHFNGGGHANAAGGHMKAPLPEVLERFHALLPSLLNGHDA